jgi:Activator of Hsp90 ATPase homolog 1-like protein
LSSAKQWTTSAFFFRRLSSKKAISDDRDLNIHNFSTDKNHSFGGKYLELKPPRIPPLHGQVRRRESPGEMITTITLKQVFCGTELNVTQEGIPAVIPAETCYLGWQESLTLLAKLVEAEIADQP